MVIPENKMQTVHLGVDTFDYFPTLITKKEPIIGYLSRMCEENGLAVLVDAFIILRRNPFYSNVKLKITGGKTGDDLTFHQRTKEKDIKCLAWRTMFFGLKNLKVWKDRNSLIQFG